MGDLAFLRTDGADASYVEGRRPFVPRVDSGAFDELAEYRARQQAWPALALNAAVQVEATKVYIVTAMEDELGAREIRAVFDSVEGAKKSVPNARWYMTDLGEAEHLIYIGDCGEERPSYGIWVFEVQR